MPFHLSDRGTVRGICLTFSAVVGLATSNVAVACVEGDIRGEAVTIERAADTTASGDEAVIRILGAGWFRAAEVVKQGGSTDDTYVTLELDGEPMISISFARLKNQWSQLDTPFLVAKVASEGDIDRMTIWYSPELKFRGMATLRVEVNEAGVGSVRMRAVMNKPAPHEHLAGQPGGIPGLPAFK